jgi:hypothetical protein
MVILLVSCPVAAAPSLRLNFGADYWIDRAGQFSATLAVLGRLTNEIAAGVRFGALINTQPTTVGIPLDLDLRVSLSKLYLEGTAGPWILFTDSPVRAHVAFGFGLQSHSISFGLELGWLDPAALLGVRLGIRL